MKNKRVQFALRELIRVYFINNPLHGFIKMFIYLTLPNDNDIPTGIRKHLDFFNIICHIFLELFLPEIHSGFRRRSIFTIWVAVPEATVNKDYGLILR